jgi:hypothetical protein
LQSIFGSWSEYTKNEREKEKDAGEEKKARESSNEMRKTYRFLVIRFKKKKKLRMKREMKWCASRLCRFEI